jgi:hypothetical protein
MEPTELDDVLVAVRVARSESVLEFLLASHLKLIVPRLRPVTLATESETSHAVKCTTKFQV